MITQDSAFNMMKVEAESFDQYINGKSFSYKSYVTALGT